MKTALRLLAVALVVAGCSSVQVSSDFDHEVDFTAFRTYGWMPSGAGTPDTFDGNTIVRKRVVSAIERELAAKGFSQAGASPDLLLAVHAYSRDRIDVTSWPSWGYDYGWWGHGCGWWGHGYHGAFGYDRIDVYQWTEGSLVVDFVSSASKELVWRGVASAAVDSSSGSEERVGETIHKLFEGFPPKR